jgi:uncharacterized protein (DUF885 family)
MGHSRLATVALPMPVATIVIAVFIAITGTTTAVTVQAAAADEFERLLQDAWEWQLREDPVFASSLGDRRYNDRWPDLSPEAIERREEAQRAFLARLAAVDSAGLDEAGRLNYDLFRRELQNDLDAYRFRNYLMPVSQRGGVQNLETTAEGLRLATVEDYDDWLERMAAVDTYIDQTTQLQERGRRAGYMPPSVLMQRVPDQIAAQLVEDAEESPYFAVFESLPESIPEEEQARLRERAAALIDGEIVPAYREYLR